ncbi:MAG: GNAT family N-acetyltransferase [Acutalibacter sp.]|nr:GNAT family N-acetyltransferase [Acutalibacter sp.]
MNLCHRLIDFEKDRDYILERHCRINYACDTSWAREKSYADYRMEWFSLKGQISEFYGYLQETAQDSRSIAEIIETEDGRNLGYLWATFSEDKESGFRFAEIQEIYIEEEFRRQGIATQLYEYAEEKARKNGAKVIRAGTGVCNSVSIQLHEALGYAPYRYEFEKLL